MDINNIGKDTTTEFNFTKYNIEYLFGGGDDNILHTIEFTDDEIKTIIALLRFSIDACPIENLPEHKIELDTVNSLVSKFEQTLK